MHRHLRLLHPVAYKEFTGRNEKIIKERVNIRYNVGGKRRSWTRKYYCRVNEDFVKCKICDRLLKISHGSYTGNINRHIRLKHPYVFFDEIKSNNSTQDDSSDEHTVKGMEHVLINESHESAERDSHSEDQDDHAVDSNIEKSVDNKSDVDQTGQALSEDELLIINKCRNRIIGKRYNVGGKRRSWTRKYYCRVNEDFVKCKICDRLLKISHGSYTGNINRHIRLKHPYVFFDEIKSNNSTQDDSSDEHTVKGMEHVLINESHESAERDSHSEDQDDHAVDSNIEKSVDNKSDVDQTGQALSEDELLIINKCRNRIIGKQHTASASRYYSWTHKYYRKINDKYNKCKICKITLKRNSLNNGNIHRHIRNKHPYIYFNETTKRRRDDCNLEYNKDAVKDDMLDVDGQPLIEDELKIKSDDEVVDKQLDTSRKLRYQSWSRKYYHKIGDKGINCIICKRVFNVEHIGNMYRHIKNMHPDIYFNETNSKTTKNETQRTEIRQEIETAVKQIFYIKEVDKIIKKDDNTEVQDEKALDSHINQSQDDMPDIDEAEKPLITTEELITKRIIERKNWSWTRKYYHKINDEGLIKCRVCDKILHFNIHRHIKNKHPDIYLKENPTASSSGPSVEEELRIKNLCGNTGKRAPKSCFWNFFEMIEQDRVYKCSFCQKSIVIFPKSVANLKRHIANVHQRQYEIILKYEESETKNLIALAASKAEVPGVSSVEITFLSLDDGDTGKYKCSRCDEVFDCKEEEDAVLIEHVQVCKLKPKLSTAESDEKVIKGIEEQNDWMIR